MLIVTVMLYHDLLPTLRCALCAFVGGIRSWHRKWFVCKVNRPKRVGPNDRSPADIACRSTGVSRPEMASILDIVLDERKGEPKQRSPTLIYDQ